MEDTANCAMVEPKPMSSIKQLQLRSIDFGDQFKRRVSELRELRNDFLRTTGSDKKDACQPDSAPNNKIQDIDDNFTENFETLSELESMIVEFKSHLG